MDELLLGAAVAHENPKTMNGGPKYHAPIPPRMIMAHVLLPGRLTPSRDYSLNDGNVRSGKMR